MKYKKVVRLYSNSRVAKYYRATNRNKNKAVMLYFANMKIAQAFHPLLSSFEVILRNQLHYALAHHFSDGNWIINQKTGFMIAPSLTYTNKRTKKKVTNDYILKAISKLPMLYSVEMKPDILLLLPLLNLPYTLTLSRLR